MKFYEICFALIAKRQGGIAAGLFSKRKEKSQNSCACGCCNTTCKTLKYDEQTHTSYDIGHFAETQSLYHFKHK